MTIALTLAPNMREPSKPATPKIKTAARFCAELEPLSYTVDRIVRSSSLYTLTARTGSGKTAWLIIVALAVATGRADILGVEVEKARVAYLAFENADDVRMRMLVAAFVFNIDLEQLGQNLIVIDQRTPPESVHEVLSREADLAPFGLIIADTLAAWFDGKDFNDAVAGGEFMRRVRPLTKVAGHPSVLVAAHPVKNASEDQLVPFGSGAILNEVDGNLTLNKRDGGICLHWQGKLRGLEFDPVPFRIELLRCPDVIDKKGAQVPLPVMRHSDVQSAANREREGHETARKVLRAILDHPKGRQEDWAIAVGRSKSTVNGYLQRLEKAKLLTKMLDTYELTTKGEKAAAGD